MYKKYTQMPGPGNGSEAPPSYNQVIHSPQPPSAPVAPVAPMPNPTQPAQQQPFVQPQTVYIQQGPQIPPLGPQPCLVTCPSCHQEHMSKIRYRTGMKTHLFAGVLCVLGLCCCACVPYFVDSCNNCNHYCSNCDAYLGMYK